MTTSMKVEIVERETIKPSSPTPHHLRNYTLSFFDQQVYEYIRIILFYHFDDNNSDRNVKSIERSQRLKESLSDILTRFYTIAGRVRDSSSIDCNDDGVDYLKARVNCRLSAILESPDGPDLNLLKAFLPFELEGTGALLHVQASFFEDCGMAIGICISHKLADAAALGTFIKNWAAAAHKSSEVVLPEFNIPSLFPPLDFSMAWPADKPMTIRRRFVFYASKITLLKAKVASPNVQQPTRVEAVSALIWKCAATASRSNLGSVRPSVLGQAVNLRTRVVPPLPDNSFGNFVDVFAIQTEESEIELHVLVDRLRKGMENFRDNYADKLLGSEGMSMILEAMKKAQYLYKRDDIDLYLFTSWCRFPLYEADFGWGKPTWVGYENSSENNIAVFVDTSDGEGIEAWVNLSEDDMALFERDKELLAFASLNPSVLNSTKPADHAVN